MPTGRARNVRQRDALRRTLHQTENACPRRRIRAPHERRHRPPKVLENGTVRVDMGEPRLLRGEIPVAGNPAEQAREVKLRADGRDFTAFCVSMGNPHAVIFVPDIEAVELEKWGPVLECDPQFPKKINVEFVEVRSPGMVRMRVWERGCGITMACGTGSCATAVAGHLSGRTGSCVTVLLDGGELLVEHSAADNHVYMTGPPWRCSGANLWRKSEMAQINSNYLKLPGSYLFAAVAKRSRLSGRPIRRPTSSGSASAT